MGRPEAKRKAKFADGAQKAQHRNPQLLRPGHRKPGDRRRAELAQQLALEHREQRANSNGDKPCLLTKKLQEKICGYLREGASLHDSAVMAGIGTKTITTWRTKGVEEPDSVYGEFLETTELARTHWKVSAIKRINQSSDWKALWKLLASRYPLEWRNYLSVSSEISGPDGSPIPMFGGGGFSVVLELSAASATAAGQDEEPQFKVVE